MASRKTPETEHTAEQKLQDAVVEAIILTDTAATEMRTVARECGLGEKVEKMLREEPKD